MATRGEAPRTLVLLVAGLALGPCLKAGPADPVAVAAGADRDYVRQKFGEDGRSSRDETYFLARGSFFGGKLRDGSLEGTQFLDIARILAPDLARHRYYPSKDSRSADLLIVVHWGVTGVEEDASHGQLDMERLNKDAAAYNAGAAKGGVTDPSALNADLDSIRAGTSLASGGPQSNANLLGFAPELEREEYRSVAMASGMTEMDRVLRADLVDERYFLIVMAYDFKSLRGGAKGAKPRLLWSTHFSMRAIGHSFTTALPLMSQVASRYFGQQVDGLLLNARDVPTGKVEVGEPRVLEDKK